MAGLIFQMTTNVSSFKRLVDTLGTSKDTRELRGKLNKQRENIGAMAKDASLAVKRLAQTVTRGGVGTRRRFARLESPRHQKLVKDSSRCSRSFSVRRRRRGARVHVSSSGVPEDCILRRQREQRRARGGARRVGAASVADGLAAAGDA